MASVDVHSRLANLSAVSPALRVCLTRIVHDAPATSGAFVQVLLMICKEEGLRPTNSAAPWLTVADPLLVTVIGRQYSHPGVALGVGKQALNDRGEIFRAEVL